LGVAALSLLQRALIFIVALVLVADMAWTGVVHFEIDGRGYGALALLSAALVAGGVFYTRMRKDERLSAMLFGAAFLVVFSAAFSLLNYLLLTVAGPRIDGSLAAADRSLGVDWPAMMAFMADWPHVNLMLKLCYGSVMPQIALLIIVLSFLGRTEQVYKLALSIALGAMLTVAFWTVFPSFGAFSVYSLPSRVSTHLSLALDHGYAADLVSLLAHGPGAISPTDAKGLVGFPSFHGALAMLVAWYGRDVAYLRWPVLVLNALVVLATPIQGGHHVVDLMGGLVVALAAVAATDRIAGLVQPRPARLAAA
jgi:hypothetical protein